MPTVSALRYRRLVHLNLTNNAINLAQSNNLGHRVQVNVDTNAFGAFFYWFRSNLEGRPVGHFQDTDVSGNTMLDLLKDVLETPYTDFDGVAKGLNFSSSVITASADADRLRETGTISVNDWIVAYVLYKCYGKSSYDTSELYNVEDMYQMLLTHDVAQEIVASLNTEEAITVAATGTSGEPGYIDTMFAQHLGSNPMRFFDSSGRQFYGLFEINPDDDAFGGWYLDNGDTFEIPIAMTFQKPVTMVGTPDPLSESKNNNEDPSNTNLTRVISSNDSFRVRLQLMMTGAGNRNGGPAGFFASASRANFSKSRVGNALVLRFKRMYSNGVAIPNSSAASVSMTINGTTVTGTSGSIVFTFPGFNFAGAGSSISYTLTYEGNTILNSFPVVDIVTSNQLTISDALENLSYLIDASGSLYIDIAQAVYNLEPIANIDVATITANVVGSETTVSGTFDSSGFHFFFETLPPSTGPTLTVHFVYIAPYVELTIPDPRYIHVLSTDETFSISASYPTNSSLRIIATGITYDGTYVTSGDLSLSSVPGLDPVIGSSNKGQWTFTFTGLTDITPSQYDFTFTLSGAEFTLYGVSVAPHDPLRIHLKASSYNGSGLWADESGNENDATLEAGTYATNSDGNGVILDGSTYWSFADVSAGNTWTASVWFKETGAPSGNYAQILTQQLDGNFVNLAIGYWGATSEIVGGFYSNGEYKTDHGSSLVSGTWTHLTVTRDTSGILHFYVNGSQTGVSDATIDSQYGTVSYNIGKSWSDQYVTGEIGEVRIYDKGLEAGEVTTLYTDTLADYAPPLILLRASSYSGSGAWNDESGNGNDATLADGTIAVNEEGNGIVLDGSTYWTFPDVNAGSNWTASVWFKQTATPSGNYSCILTQEVLGEAPYPINMLIGYDNDTSNILGGFHNASLRLTDSVNVSNNVWMNYVVTYDGTTINFYRSGVLAHSASSGLTSFTANLPYRIGRRWDTANYVVGEIGEVRIYNSVLPNSRILSMFRATIQSYSTFKLLLRALDYSGTGYWNDESGNHNNASLADGTNAKNAAGNGIVLDGSTYWTFPDVNAGANWTAIIWYKQTEAEPAGEYASTILSQKTNSNNTTNLFIGYFDTNVGIQAGHLNSGAFYEYTSTLYQLQNTWTHIAVTKSSESIKMYINGSLYTSINSSLSAITTGLVYRIGKSFDDYSGFVKGEIGEVRIYSKALSAAGISRLYTNSAASYPRFSVTMIPTIGAEAGTYTTGTDKDGDPDQPGNLTFCIEASSITFNGTAITEANAALLSATTAGNNSATATYANNAFYFIFVDIETSDPNVVETITLTFAYNTVTTTTVTIADPRYVPPPFTLTTSANITAEFTDTSYSSTSPPDGDVFLQITVPVNDLSYTGGSIVSSKVAVNVALKNSSGDTISSTSIEYDNGTEILQFEGTVSASDATNTVSLEIEFSYAENNTTTYTADPTAKDIITYVSGPVFTVINPLSGGPVIAEYISETEFLLTVTNSNFILDQSNMNGNESGTLSVDVSGTTISSRYIAGNGTYEFATSNLSGLSGDKAFTFKYNGAQGARRTINVTPYSSNTILTIDPSGVTYPIIDTDNGNIGLTVPKENLLYGISGETLNEITTGTTDVMPSVRVITGGSGEPVKSFATYNEVGNTFIFNLYPYTSFGQSVDLKFSYRGKDAIISPVTIPSYLYINDGGTANFTSETSVEITVLNQGLSYNGALISYNTNTQTLSKNFTLSLSIGSSSISTTDSTKVSVNPADQSLVFTFSNLTAPINSTFTLTFTCDGTTASAAPLTDTRYNASNYLYVYPSSSISGAFISNSSVAITIPKANFYYLQEQVDSSNIITSTSGSKNNEITVKYANSSGIDSGYPVENGSDLVFTMDLSSYDPPMTTGTFGGTDPQFYIAFHRLAGSGEGTANNVYTIHVPPYSGGGGGGEEGGDSFTLNSSFIIDSAYYGNNLLDIQIDESMFLLNGLTASSNAQITLNFFELDLGNATATSNGMGKWTFSFNTENSNYNSSAGLSGLRTFIFAIFGTSTTASKELNLQV